MEAILPILGAVIVIWLLSRINHGDNSQTEETVQDRKAPSLSSDAEQAALLLEKVKSKQADNEIETDSDGRQKTYSGASDEELVATINVKTKDIMENNEFEGMDTPTLVRAILTKLNCQQEENEDGTLVFSYQGETFWVNSRSDTSWIRIVDLSWFNCPLDQLEEVSCVQRAINSANSVQQCTACYIIDKEENQMRVYSKADILIKSVFPYPDQYLQSWLAAFFRLQQEVALQYQKEKQKVGGAEQE